MSIENNLPECPWPEDVWPMTKAEYVNAVPDPNVRTAISGFLMREGWELCIKQLESLLQEFEEKEQALPEVLADVNAHTFETGELEYKKEDLPDGSTKHHLSRNGSHVIWIMVKDKFEVGMIQDEFGEWHPIDKSNFELIKKIIHIIEFC